jgi:hypothetical protein
MAPAIAPTPAKIVTLGEISPSPILVPMDGLLFAFPDAAQGAGVSRPRRIFVVGASEAWAPRRRKLRQTRPFAMRQTVAALGEKISQN